MDFFQNLNFSSANEDGESELIALSKASRILCLTGSGTRPLDMLMSDAQEVIALDLNPTQNALLTLKVAAFQQLEHGELLAFLGLSPVKDRARTYDLLRAHLPSDARAYWDKNRKVIKAGVWHQGKWEKLLAWNARFLKLYRRGAIDALMEAPDLGAQEAIWQQKFANSRLRALLEMIGRDWIWRWVMNEPAGEFLPNPAEVSRRLEVDFARASTSFLFRDSDFATLIFRGHHSADGALPVHLREENFQRMRDHLPKLRIVEGGLADLAGERHGEMNTGAVDGFSLSDFGSYCGPDVYAACWRGVLAVSAPHASYCERIFMNDMPPPFASIHVDQALSDQLTAKDKAIIYRIRAGYTEKATDG